MFKLVSTFIVLLAVVVFGYYLHPYVLGSIGIGQYAKPVLAEHDPNKSSKENLFADLNYYYQMSQKENNTTEALQIAKQLALEELTPDEAAIAANSLFVIRDYAEQQALSPDETWGNLSEINFLMGDLLNRAEPNETEKTRFNISAAQFHLGIHYLKEYNVRKDKSIIKSSKYWIDKSGLEARAVLRTYQLEDYDLFP